MTHDEHPLALGSLRVVSAVGLVLMWELMSRTYWPTLFPSPSSVARALVEMAQTGELFADVWYSLRRVVIGFTIAAILGVSLGVLTGYLRVWERTVGLLIQCLRPIPSIALVSFAIVWFGLGEVAKVFLIAWSAFFAIWVNTHLGILRVDPQLLWAASSLGASATQRAVYVAIPAALGPILAGLRTGIGLAFVGLVASELAGSFAGYGLGYRIEVSHLVFRTDRMMASLCVLGLLGATCDHLFARVAHIWTPWLTHA